MRGRQPEPSRGLDVAGHLGSASKIFRFIKANHFDVELVGGVKHRAEIYHGQVGTAGVRAVGSLTDAIARGPAISGRTRPRDAYVDDDLSMDSVAWRERVTA